MWETCFLRFLHCLRYVQPMYPDFTSNSRNIFALLQNCIKLICFILILISVLTSLFHDFKATIFVLKNHNRITIPDFCGIIVMFVPEIILAVDRSTEGLAFETHANAFCCILTL